MGSWRECPSVERNSEKVGGAYVFEGTRIPVRALFENLEDGATVDEFLEWFPGVDRHQVEAVLEFAAASLEEHVAAWESPSTKGFLFHSAGFCTPWPWIPQWKRVGPNSTTALSSNTPNEMDTTPWSRRTKTFDTNKTSNTAKSRSLSWKRPLGREFEMALKKWLLGWLKSHQEVSWKSIFPEEKTCVPSRAFSLTQERRGPPRATPLERLLQKSRQIRHWEKS